MKKRISVILSLLILISLCSLSVLAANKKDLSAITLPKPPAPRYFTFENERGAD